jgi:hypothetical protein
VNPDEAILTRRLHDELDLPDIGPAPVQDVLRRSRRAVRRRLTGAGCVAAGLAVAASVLAVRGGTTPRGTGPGISAPHAWVFASGSIGGRTWRLAVVNLADPGRACLPGVMLNSANGDLLQPGFLPGLALGSVAFLEPTPGRPAPGWAFVLLRPGVRDIAAVLRDGTTISARPVTVRACGQQFRLAGLAYPAGGVLRLTARSALGRPIGYVPDADIFNPASPLQDGQWFNVGPGALAKPVSGLIGSGRTGGTAWRAWVSLGSNGECFAIGIGGSGPNPGSAEVCGTIGEPPAGASLTPLPYGTARRTLVWYYGLVNPRTAYAIARLSDGVALRLSPAIVDGRSYLVLGTRAQVKLVRLTLYDARGHVLATVRWPPRRPT